MSLTASCSNIFLATGTGRFRIRPDLPREQRTVISAIRISSSPHAVLGSSVPVMSLPTPEREEPPMPRRFMRAVRGAEVVGAVVAAAVLAILFLPKLAGGGDAAPPRIQEPGLNVAVPPAVGSAAFLVGPPPGFVAAHGP